MTWKRSYFRRFFADYGIIFVLLLLCAFFSFATLKEQHPAGADAASDLWRTLQNQHPDARRILIIAHTGRAGQIFAETLSQTAQNHPDITSQTVAGEPHLVRETLENLAQTPQPPQAILATRQAAQWPFLQNLASQFPSLAQTTLLTPQSYLWPDFLKRSNLMAIADRIVVIALIAIGMTMVIITGGIDLSVGSLIAFSAVLATVFIRNFAGAENASAIGMTLACLAAIALAACVGLFSGAMVTYFLIPPFIVTLAMMLVANGLAFIVAAGQSIYQVPDSLIWLGRGASLLGIPNTVVLMALLYAIAHVIMTRTTLGRYIYAVGGNQEAARLSGVPVKRILIFVYAASAALAGLGGVVQASQLKSGAPTYGVMYELYVIAAVVVGGTSLTGGQGKILATLVGAFIIAVIQNGMNLIGVESYTQKVVLGLVILVAVLLDMLKKRGLPLPRFLRHARTEQPTAPNQETLTP